MGKKSWTNERWIRSLMKRMGNLQIVQLRSHANFSLCRHDCALIHGWTTLYFRGKGGCHVHEGRRYCHSRQPALLSRVQRISQHLCGLIRSPYLLFAVVRLHKLKYHEPCGGLSLVQPLLTCRIEPRHMSKQEGRQDRQNRTIHEK